jgi:hypothetical protein
LLQGALLRDLLDLIKRLLVYASICVVSWSGWLIVSLALR